LDLKTGGNGERRDDLLDGIARNFDKEVTSPLQKCRNMEVSLLQGGTYALVAAPGALWACHRPCLSSIA
jgi:hypothetical protein